MTTPASVVTGAGLRGVYIYPLDANGLIASPTTVTMYRGVHVQGARIINLTDPAPRRIDHVGEDRAFALTMLPPNTFLTGQMQVGKRNRIVDALLTGQAEATIGEGKWWGVGTDMRGFEKQVCLLGYSTTQEADEDGANLGTQAWDITLIPKCKLFQLENNRDENALNINYDLAPYPVTHYPWGTAFSVATEKYKQATMLTGILAGKLVLCAFSGDGATLIFNFPTGVIALSAAKVTVVLKSTGAIISANMTATTTGITFDSGHAPAALADYVVLIET